MPMWRLLAANARRVEFPETLRIPPREVIRKLKPGDEARLILEIDGDDPTGPDQERTWVRVVEVLAGDRFNGGPLGDPLLFEYLELGNRIRFSAHHIIDLRRAGPIHPTDPHGMMCVVSHRMLFDDRRVGLLVRREPQSEADSGWCMTAHEESEEYLRDPRNFSWVSLRAALARDDSIRGLLDEFIGTTFIRCMVSGKLERYRSF